jgi:single-strand DNA-binding protein
VVGRITQQRWVGVSGKEQSKVVIVAEHIEFRPVESNEWGMPPDDFVPEGE